MEDIDILRSINQAIRSGDISVVKNLIKQDLSRLSMETPFGTWLHVACLRGQLEIVKYLISKGLSPNVRTGPANNRPLYNATTWGHFEIADYLLNKGAVMDTDTPEANPLFGAIIKGQIDTAKLTIEKGIDTQVRYTTETMDNMNAYDLAMEYGRAEIVSLLHTD